MAPNEVFTDHTKKLARRDIIRGRLHAAVGQIEPVNEGETQGIGSLDNAPAHGSEDSKRGGRAPMIDGAKVRGKKRPERRVPGLGF